MYDSLVIAQYIISKCFKEEHPVSNLRLQKLLYLVQGQSYRILNKKLFDEDFYAWPYGPVIPEIYFQYCGYAGAPISLEYNSIHIDDNVKKMIDKTIKIFSPYSDWDLVRFTHEQDAPWYRYKDTRGLIPKDEIKNYFKQFGGS